LVADWINASKRRISDSEGYDDDQQLRAVFFQPASLAIFGSDFGFFVGGG
jgi:hypothetical protein